MAESVLGSKTHINVLAFISKPVAKMFFQGGIIFFFSKQTRLASLVQ